MPITVIARCFTIFATIKFVAGTASECIVSTAAPQVIISGTPFESVIAHPPLRWSPSPAEG